MLLSCWARRNKGTPREHLEAQTELMPTTWSQKFALKIALSRILTFLSRPRFWCFRKGLSIYDVNDFFLNILTRISPTTAFRCPSLHPLIGHAVKKKSFSCDCIEKNILQVSLVGRFTAAVPITQFFIFKI